mmetsp:Transcript_2766/g.5194  ORF Transcript_2766/g.5194 Transcript_2766/m.5194 type:complete len:85 (+) Transcript_2766:281-535(+)
MGRQYGMNCSRTDITPSLYRAADIAVPAAFLAEDPLYPAYEVLTGAEYVCTPDVYDWYDAWIDGVTAAESIALTSPARSVPRAV